MKLSFRQKLQVIKAYKESGGKDPLYSVLSKFENGGDLPEKSPTIVDNKLEDDNLVGMMKARMAMASQFGNTSAQRMTSVSPKTYQFTGNEQINGEYIGVPKGEVGTHFMSSMDNYAVPFIQERDGNMQFISNPSYKDSESIKFDRPYDAEYFAEHYKEVAPMMQSFESGGSLPDTIRNPYAFPDILNTNKPVLNYNNSLNEDVITHKIISGDTLYKISKKYNTDIDSIKRLNPNIKDINKIYPNQEIVVNKKVTTNIPNDLDYRKKTPFELDEINKSLSNIDKIKLYESTTPSGEFYIVEDKKSHVVNVMSPNGDIIKQYNSVSGRNKGDALTVTYTNKDKTIKDGAGNLSTPSGMFRISSQGEYHGVPSFTRSKVSEDYDIPSSVHKRNIPSDKSKCNTSNGCTGLSEESLLDLKKYAGKNTRWYILPEEDNSGEFRITGNGLSFISNDPNKLFSEHAKGSRNIKIIPPKDLQNNNNVTTAINTIQSSKGKFMDRLNMSSDTYDRLSMLALGIMGRESGYGNPGIRGMYGLIRDDVGALMGENVSAGDYQLRSTSVPKQMLNKIIGKNTLDYKDLKNNVISTQAVITSLYDIYKNIAPKYKERYPDMSLDEITLAYYTNPQGFTNPDKSIIRRQYAKDVLENVKNFNIKY